MITENIISMFISVSFYPSKSNLIPKHKTNSNLENTTVTVK